MGYYDQILNSTITGAGAGAGIAGGYGALVGGGLGLMSGIMAGDPAVNQIVQQQRLNGMQISGNKELANYSQNLQKDMWNYTNYENQIKHLKAAGLNPALMYAKGGVGGQTGSANAGQVAGSHASSEAEREAIGIQRNAQMLQTAMNITQMQNIKADTKVKEAEAEKIKGVDTEYTKSQTDVNIANIKLIGENTENTRLRNLGQETQNELLKLEKLYQEGTLDARILNQTLVNDNLSANIRKLNEEIPWIGKLAQGQLNVYEADVKLKDSQVKVNEQNVKTGKAEERLKLFQGTAQNFENTKEQRDLRTREKTAHISTTEQQAITQSLQNKYFKEYGIVPGSGMANVISTLIAKFVDENGGRLLAGEKEVLRELEQLLKEAQKESENVLGKYQTGKFWWE